MFAEYMDEYISDVQYFEGVISTFGKIISFVFFLRVLSIRNIRIIVGLSFLSTWVFRKLLINYYVILKNHFEKSFIDKATLFPPDLFKFSGSLFPLVQMLLSLDKSFPFSCENKQNLTPATAIGIDVLKQHF